MEARTSFNVSRRAFTSNSFTFEALALLPMRRIVWEACALLGEPSTRLRAYPSFSSVKVHLERIFGYLMWKWTLQAGARKG